MKSAHICLVTLTFLFSALFTTSAIALGNLKSATTMTIYFTIPKSGEEYATTQLFLALPSSNTAENGSFDMEHPVKVNTTLPVITWSTPLEPHLTTEGVNSDVDPSKCPGMDTNYWTCASTKIDISIHFEPPDCPWNITMYTVNRDSLTGKSWTSPPYRDTSCPTVPVATYDISWSPDSIQHNKQLILNPTGEVIETTLHTYLMESGLLCDGSLMDERGAYCRYVSTGVSISILGCDDTHVTTSVTKRPMTDTILDDINVQVDTTHIGSGMFSTTCNFRYLIDEL